MIAESPAGIKQKTEEAISRSVRRSMESVRSVPWPCAKIPREAALDVSTAVLAAAALAAAALAAAVLAAEATSDASAAACASSRRVSARHRPSFSSRLHGAGFDIGAGC